MVGGQGAAGMRAFHTNRLVGHFFRRMKTSKAFLASTEKNGLFMS
jgi:hypothetical protein